MKDIIFKIATILLPLSILLVPNGFSVAADPAQMPPPIQKNEAPDQERSQISPGAPGSPGQQMPPMGGCCMMCSGMTGMNMGMNQQMSHSMTQELTMKDIMHLLTMQDLLQVLADMIQVQEKMASAGSSREKVALKKELAEIRERTKKIMSEYRGMIVGQPQE